MSTSPLQGFRIATPITRALTTLSRREWIFLASLTTLLALVTIGMLAKLNSLYMVTIPVHGGIWKEGELASPRFINPVLAYSENDRDMTKLIFAGLMKESVDGTIVPDLTDHYVVSDDHLTYTVTLKNNLTFHDDTPLTAHDVVFTIEKIQDPTLGSPKYLAWQGVTATAPDEKTVVFTLKQPYAPFLNSLTIGILPSHIWEFIATEEFPLSDYNVNPIGEGPYKIKNISKSSGIPSEFNLTAFPGYQDESPYITNLVIKTYASEKDLTHALMVHNVNAIHGVSADGAITLKEAGFTVEHVVLPRIFALFYNASHNQIFADHAVLSAINLAIDKNKLVDNVLKGYGTQIDSPLPVERFDVASTGLSYTESITEANSVLEKAGWVLGTDGIRAKTDKKTGTKKLTFSIATANIPDLADAAEQIKSDLAPLGISVTIEVYDVGTLNQTVIGPRDYDALFFGQIVSTDADLYAFWHSSERADPGLNIALYANPKVDGYLAQALTTFDENTAKALYEKAGALISSDLGAIFVYSPEFIYIHDNSINNLNLTHIEEAYDRFTDISHWYLETDRVWKIFAH